MGFRVQFFEIGIRVFFPQPGVARSASLASLASSSPRRLKIPVTRTEGQLILQAAEACFKHLSAACIANEGGPVAFGNCLRQAASACLACDKHAEAG